MPPSLALLLPCSPALPAFFNDPKGQACDKGRDIPFPQVGGSLVAGFVPAVQVPLLIIPAGMLPRWPHWEFHQLSLCNKHSLWTHSLRIACTAERNWLGGRPHRRL